MTTVRTASGSPRQPTLSAHRVGPVITTVAAVVAALIVFGLGVLAGRVGASLLGLHGSGRTALMLGAGVVLGLASIGSSARRHLRRQASDG